jgi:hypothetical protein
VIKSETRTILHCTCERPSCRHEWDSFRRDKRTGRLVSEKPRRCAKCKYLSWNAEDRRRAYGFEPDPTASGKGKETLLETLTESKNILEQLIADLGPCDHSKKICVCVETEVLAKVNNQIAKLAEKKGKHTLAKTV